MTAGSGTCGLPTLSRHFILAALFVLLLTGGCHNHNTVEAQQHEPGKHLVFPATGAYTGAYIDFGDNEDAVTLDAIEDFEAMVGKHQAIIASSSFWGEQTFPLKNLRIISRHGSIPLVYWSPWDRPYVQERPPDRFSLRNIIAGKWDSYIDRWADMAKAYGKPMLVSWGLEMNGSWFPWSGCFYGGERRVPGGRQPRFEGPDVYKKAFRYVVNRVKARGAVNILWGFHANNFSFPDSTWNSIVRYYPGSDVVDWLGLSVYGIQYLSQNWWSSFTQVMDAPYRAICRLDPDKPFILAEWGVGEFPTLGNKSKWIDHAFHALESKYPRLKGAIYWHERWQNSDGSYSNLRINSSPEALEVYRKDLAAAFWVGTPQLQP